MITCTILIPIVNEIEFLKGCISQIKKFEHPEIKSKIIIADQSNGDIIVDLYKNDKNITIIKENL